MKLVEAITVLDAHCPDQVFSVRTAWITFRRRVPCVGCGWVKVDRGSINWEVGKLYLVWGLNHDIGMAYSPDCADGGWSLECVNAYCSALDSSWIEYFLDPDFLIPIIPRG